MIRWKKLEGNEKEQLRYEFHEFLKFIRKEELSKELKAWEKSLGGDFAEGHGFYYLVEYKVFALAKSLLFKVRYIKKDWAGHSPVRIAGKGEFTQEIKFWKTKIQSNRGPYR